MAAVRSRQLRTPPRATRAKAAISYAESSSDDEDAVASDAEGFRALRPTPRSRTTRSAKSQRTSTPHHKRNRSDNVEYTNTPKRSKTSRSSRPNTPKAVAASAIEFVKGSGVILKWQNIEPAIWQGIFRFAAYPLCDEQFRSLPSAQWLAKLIPLCRVFGSEASSVLYASPPLIPMGQAHGLVRLLQGNPALGYRQMIRSLQIEVKNVVAYTLPGSGHLDLFQLIKDLPLLKNLEFYHEYDMTPYRNLDSTIKWKYLEDIFRALEYVDHAADARRGDKTTVCYLQSWRWSSRLAGDRYPIEGMAALHLKPYFMTLRKIAFVNYQVPFFKEDEEEDPKHEDALAKAIKALPKLEHLIFESSTLVNSTLLPLLPTGLRQLELVNCWEVVADDFAEFLLTHGRQLRCLTLNHNQSLSLAFLPVLGDGCPNLEILHMNLTYFNMHATYRDSNPQYEQLLLPEHLPVWPSTLQIVELFHLRKWETNTAEMFFQSLLDAADNLPYLRKLSLQAILNIGWRDRASFRDKWVGSLNRVFKRVSEPPLPRTSLRALPAPEQSLFNTKGISDNKQAPESSERSSQGSTSTEDDGPSTSAAPRTISLPQRSKEPPLARRSARTSTLTTKTGKYAESSSESEPIIPAPSPKRNRSNRLARELEVLKQTAGSDTPNLSNSNSNSNPDSDSDASVTEKKKGKGKGKEIVKKQAIQGMCDVVEVRIDNLRPSENQVTEADFLDEERSGDEDWNGRDANDYGYA